MVQNEHSFLSSKRYHMSRASHNLLSVPSSVALKPVSTATRKGHFVAQPNGATVAHRSPGVSPGLGGCLPPTLATCPPSCTIPLIVGLHGQQDRRGPFRERNGHATTS